MADQPKYPIHLDAKELHPMHQMKDINPPRSLIPLEKALIDFLLSEPFPGQKELRRQQIVGVPAECSICPTISLLVNPDPGTRASVKRRIPVEAEGDEAEGKRVHVLLHVINGFLAELEVYREDGETIGALPEPSSLKLVHLGQPESSISD